MVLRLPGTRLWVSSSWVWLSFAVIVVAGLSAISANRAKPPLPLDVTSVKPDGALALYRWLERSGYQVKNETNPALGLAHLRAGRDTFMILRETEVSSDQIGALLRWVRQGGRLVLATDPDTDERLLAALRLRVRSADPELVQVGQPLLLAPPVLTLYGSASTVVQGNGADTRVASTAEGSVLLIRRVGPGQIWLLSAPELLDNSHIARADNRRLLLNLAGAPGARVSFDQAGAAATPQSQPNWLTDTNWGVAVVFGVLVLLVFRWLSGFRLGPPLIPPDDRQRPAAEYVVSIAGLLRRAHKRVEVLDRYQQSLRRALRTRYGTEDPTALDAMERDRLQRLLAPAPHVTEDELLRRSAEIVEYEEELRMTRV